jgi:hypothetical protein
MMANVFVVSPFLLLCLLIPFQKSIGIKFEFILLSLVLNPIGLGIGIFQSSWVSNFANLLYYIFLPMLLNRQFFSGKSPHFLKNKLRFFLFLLVLPTILSMSLFGLEMSIKTLILFIGTWKWAVLVSNFAQDPSFAFHSGATYWTFIRAGSVALLLASFLPEYYVFDNRLILSGGFSATSTLSLCLIYLSYFAKKVSMIQVAIGLFLGITLLIKSGSVAGTFAVIFFILLIPFLGGSKMSFQQVGPGKFFLTYFILPISAYFLVSETSLNATRNYNIVSLFSSDASGTLGTVEWRKSMWSYMWNYFQNSNLINQIFGNGLGSGTEIARLSYGNIPSEYTSSRIFHNGLLQLLIENGVLGLFFFMFLFFGILWKIPKQNYLSFLIWIIAYTLILVSGNPFAIGGTVSVLTLGLVLSLIVVKNPLNESAKSSEVRNFT